jgi:hypothetical protein
VAAGAFDIAPRFFHLRPLHLRQCLRTTAGAAENGRHRFQFAKKRRRFGGNGLWLTVAQCFEEQFRRVGNAFANGRRAIAPGGIELSGFAGIGAESDERRGHALAVVQAGARHGHQKLHGDVRPELSFANLPLDGFGQKFGQRQSPRNPACAFIEAARQFVGTEAEAVFQFRQQPALFQSGFMFGEAERTVEDQGFGFAHGPDHCIHRVVAQLAQRGEALIAVDDEVTFAVRGGYDDDGRLLSRFGERGEEAALALGLAHTQMLIGPVELVKFQLHRRGRRWGPVCGLPETAFSRREREVGWEALSDQRDTP